MRLMYLPEIIKVFSMCEIPLDMMILDSLADPYVTTGLPIAAYVLDDKYLFGFDTPLEQNLGFLLLPQ